MFPFDSIPGGPATDAGSCGYPAGPCRESRYSGYVPVHRVDPAALGGAGRALAPLRERAAEAEDDLLSAPLLAGDAGLQHALDAWVDHVVDALRAVGEEAAEQATVLRAVAVGSDVAEDAVTRSVRTALPGGRQ